MPLRGEADVIGRLVQALSGLRYPAGKLQILLLLEEYDAETLAAVAAADMPGHFHALTVPDAGPRTKPKACNFGYLHATGDIVVIFDAEDRPQADQLLRAAAGFRAAARDRWLGCLQARLAFWNPRGSWISSFYWAEYVTHFRWALVGMARLRLIPPLGGTSNHFRVEALDAVARANGPREFEGGDGRPVVISGPWDPYNVTEDADLAFRLALAGYRIGMLDSTTYEEAPDTAGKARNQRGRWLHGYAQTGLVHTRHPLAAMRELGPLRYLAFILFMLGTPASLLLNPLMWAATVLYVVARLDALTAVSAFIDRLFPRRCSTLACSPRWRAMPSSTARCSSLRSASSSSRPRCSRPAASSTRWLGTCASSSTAWFRCCCSRPCGGRSPPCPPAAACASCCRCRAGRSGTRHRTGMPWRQRPSSADRAPCRSVSADAEFRLTLTLSSG